MSKVLDFNTYKEAMRTTRTFGIFSVVLLGLVSFFSTVSEIINTLSYGHTDNAKTYIDLFSVNPLLLLLFCLVAPLMMINAMRFTTSRAASDFYFSMPKTRTQLYFCGFAAVFTWVLLTLFISAAIPAVAFLIFKKYFVYKMLSSFLYILTLLVSSFYIMSAVALAVSVTGTVFSNITTALLIIFAPRLFITVILEAAVYSMSIVDISNAFGLLSSDINIPFSLVFSFGVGLFDNTGAIDITATAYIYTTVLGIIYLIIGWRIFTHRKSEAAEKAASTTVMRTVIRVALGAVVGLIPTVFINTMIIEGVNAENLLFTAMFAVFAFIVFCGYELLSTRSAKSMVSAMPTFLFSVIIDIVALVIILTAKHAVLSFEPTAKEIKSVTISQYNFTYGSSTDGYFAAQASKLELDDEDIRKLVSNVLSENVANERIALKKRHYQSWSITDEYYSYNVVIKTASGTHYRILQFDNKNYDKLLQLLSNNEQYKNIYTKLPDPNSPETTAVMSRYDYSVSNDDALKLYKAYLTDVENQSFEKLYNDRVNGSDEATIVQFDIDTVLGTKNYTICIMADSSYKSTVNTFYSIVEKKSIANREKLLKNLKEQVKEENIIVETHNIYKDYVYFDIDRNNVDEIEKLLSKASVTDLSVDSPVIRVYYNIYDEEKCEYIKTDVYFALDNEQLSQFLKIAPAVSEQ